MALLSLVASGLLGGLVVTGALAELSESKDTKTLVYPQPGTATAKCKGQDHVAFGGFKTDTVVPLGAGPTAAVYAMGPSGSDTDKWLVKGHNRSAAYDAELTAYAYCDDGKEPKVERASKIAPAQNYQETEVSAACPKGKTLIGGGWSSNPDNTTGGVVILTGLERQPKSQTWQVTVANEKPAPVTITAIALCGSGSTPKIAQGKVSVRENTGKGATAACPEGKEVVFGGLRATYDAAPYPHEDRATIPTRFYRPTKNKVTAYAVNNPGGENFNSQADITAYAYCR